MTENNRSLKPNAQELLDLMSKRDLCMDVNGGNPYSPIWICGMEFGGGINYWESFKSASEHDTDLATSGCFCYHDVNAYEYRTISSALVAALADCKFHDALHGCHDDQERKNLVYQWATERKLFCWGGHGFQMNSSPLSLVTHDDMDHSYVYYNHNWDKLTVREFLTLTKYSNLYDFRKEVISSFRPFVQARLNRYRPHLVICTGHKSEKDFQKLFLEEENPAPIFQYDNKDSYDNTRQRFECYLNKRTQTFVVICHFLTNKRASTLRLNLIADFVDKLRACPELHWLKDLDSISPWPPLINANSFQKAEYLTTLRNIDTIRFDQDFKQYIFVQDPRVLQFIEKVNTKDIFYSQISKLRSKGDLAWLTEIQPTTMERFQALLTDQIEKPKDERIWLIPAIDLMLDHLKKQKLLHF